MWQFLLNPFQHAKIPLDAWVTALVDWLVSNFRGIFQAIRLPIDYVLVAINSALNAMPPMVILAVLLLIGWQLAGIKTTSLAILFMVLIGLIGTWSQTMTTVSLVVTAVIFCALIGIPLGILSARSRRFESWLRPILDAMQTTPSFVYLVPVVMLFGIGNVPGVIVTIVFGLPPLIRLTSLGIRQVPEDVVEGALAFGASPKQLLFKVQIPLAMPTIMAGLNQTIMLSVSMVVIASMIAVGGLGQMVLRGIGRLDMGLASVGGLGIVLLAITLDRLTQAFARPPRERGPRHWYQKGPTRFVTKLEAVISNK